MITNKDISIDSENGKITLNGNKYDLGTQGEIDTAVKDIYSVMGQNGAKNLIPYPYAQDSYSQRGIEFTALSDGTINANGTNDGTANSTFSFAGITLSKGTYIINGCPTQTGTNYRCGVVRSSDSVTLASDFGSGAKFTLDADTVVRIFVQVYSGKTANNIIFKPMLRLASDTDDTYQPYAMTNKQLTEQVANKLNISNVRSGRSTFPAAEATGNQTMQINFSTPLEHAPFILVSWDDNPDLASYFKYPLRITDVNVNGFKVTAERLIATSEWHIRWIAIDM